MALSHANPYRSCNHRTTSLQTLSLSKTPRLAHHSRDMANTTNSPLLAKQTSPLINSRISKHRKTATTVTSSINTSTTRKTSRHLPKNTPITSAATTQAPIIIHLNNRLGIRTAIQCSPQDTIHTLKLLASLKLGTRPEAMMLKRQGQWAFKDQLRLEDYEIGNGSSVDLEVDTED